MKKKLSEVKYLFTKNMRNLWPEIVVKMEYGTNGGLGFRNPKADFSLIPDARKNKYAKIEKFSKDRAKPAKVAYLFTNFCKKFNCI
jgi:hypothetical protein